MTSTAQPTSARSAVGHLIATAFVVLVALGTPALAVSSLRWATGPGCTLLGAATVLAFAGIFFGAGRAISRLLGPVR